MRLRSPRDFGALVQKRRQELHWTQDALAREAGTSREWIGDLEKGKPRVPLALVLRALTALGIAIGTAEEAGIQYTRTKKNRAGGTGAADINEVLRRLRRKK